MSFVHNHGPAEGQGFDCYEYNLGDNLIGWCLLKEAGFTPPVRYALGLDPAGKETAAIIVQMDPNRSGAPRLITHPADAYYADWDGSIRQRSAA